MLHQQMNTSTSPLADAIGRTMAMFASQLVQARQLTQYQSTEFLQALQQHGGQIYEHLARQYQYAPDGVPPGAVTAIVQQYGQNVMQQMMSMNRPANSMMQSMGQNSMGYRPVDTGWNYQNNPHSGGMMHTPMTAAHGGAPSMTRPDQQPKQAPQASPTSYGQPPQPEVAPNAYELVVRKNPTMKYSETVDRDAARFNTVCNNGNMVEVPERVTLTDTVGATFTYNRAHALIMEPSLSRVVSIFQDTNPKLLTGKHITNLWYSVFDLKRIPAPKGGHIDLSPLESSTPDALPPRVAIEKVLDSLGQIDHAAVKQIEKMVLYRLNDRLDRFLRSSADMNNPIRLEKLDDIVDLVGMRSSKDPLLGNPAFESTVLRLFKESVDGVITSAAPRGYLEAEDVALDLLAHPGFIIREHKLCEREIDPRDPEAIKAIKSRYTAFHQEGWIAFGNFIPGDDADEFINDLEGTYIDASRITNPLDYLVCHKWGRQTPERVILSEGDRSITLKVGTTIEGIRFYCKDTGVK